jgi:lipoprotein-anchoring transpeptidase ErfK/SrfK
VTFLGSEEPAGVLPAMAAVAGTATAAATSVTARRNRVRSMPLQRPEREEVTANITCVSGTFFAPVSRRSIVILLAFLLGPMFLVACGDTSASAPVEGPAYVATALVPKVPIYDAPHSPSSKQSLTNPDTYGQPLTFLVLDQQDDWVKVALPVRPNGSSGWVQLEKVSLKRTPFRLKVALGAHELRLFKDGALSQTFPIGVGTSETPTPGGTYYLRVLIKTTNPSGAYGPYAYGLNGFSQVLNDFAGGDGVIGLHGTNDPSSIGKDVSHGCIRLRNADITTLAKILPLGTPVEILP